MASCTTRQRTAKAAAHTARSNRTHSAVARDQTIRKPDTPGTAPPRRAPMETLGLLAALSLPLLPVLFVLARWGANRWRYRRVPGGATSACRGVPRRGGRHSGGMQRGAPARAPSLPAGLLSSARGPAPRATAAAFATAFSASLPKPLPLPPPCQAPLLPPSSATSWSCAAAGPCTPTWTRAGAATGACSRWGWAGGLRPMAPAARCQAPADVTHARSNVLRPPLHSIVLRPPLHSILKPYPKDLPGFQNVPVCGGAKYGSQSDVQGAQ